MPTPLKDPTRPGRPKLPKGQRRAYIVQVHWTEAEWKRLTELAGGRPQPEYIRESVLMRVR